MDQHDAPSKGSYFKQRPIRIRFHRYGTIKLHLLTLGTSGFLYKLVSLNLPEREFAVQLIHHYLADPELGLEAIRGWPDRLLLRVELAWIQGNDRVNQRLSTSPPTLKELQQALVEYTNERTQHIQDAITRSLDSWLSTNSWLHTDLHSALQNTMRTLQNGIQKEIQSVVQQALAAVEQSTRGLLQAALDSITESVNAFGQDIVAAGLNQIRELQPILPALSELSAFIQWLEVANDFDESGYSFTSHLWEGAFVGSLAQVSPKVRKATLTNKILAVTRSQAFGSTLQELFGCSTQMTRRWKIIKPALGHHRQREYLASIPLLLPQVEGLFTELMILSRLAAPKGRKLYARGTDGEIRLDRKGKPIPLMTLHSKAESASQFSDQFTNREILEQVVDLFLNKLIAERNDILHGRRTAYGTAKLSNQLLLLIFVLASEIAYFPTREDSASAQPSI